MTYIPTFFQPHEVVPPAVFAALSGDPVRIFRLFDERILITCDRLRGRYGSMTINNWQWGGERKESGLRDPFSATGAKWSDHKFGRAIDAVFKLPAAEIRRDILSDPWHPDFEHITCLEMTIGGKPISWLHFACRNWDKARSGILQLNL
jgi:hypothetical protein